MRARRPLAWIAMLCTALLALGNTKCEISDVAPAAYAAFKELSRKVRGLSEEVEQLEREVGDLAQCTCCCEGILAPVCAADGTTYVNACEAECAGVPVVARGSCSDDACGGPEGIACGEGSFCELPPGCDPMALGRCLEQPPACPTDEYVPVCGCDGITYANDCERRAAGVPLAHRGECEVPPDRCRSSAECGPDELCETPPGRCDALGSCMPRPTLCTRELAPVCGCDGRTYPNACVALAEGVSIAHRGECAPPLCRSDDACPEGSFCELDGCPDGSSEPAGACVPRPEQCPQIFRPVCGCDGVTYGNDCERRAAGVSRAHEGPCEGPPPFCEGNDDCDPRDFCARPEGQCRDTGECRPRPEICPLALIPVCGCDGRTYGNACEAAQAGVSVAHDGPCEVPVRCGGIAGIPCPAPTQFCRLPAGTCSSADLFGECVEVPDACVEIYDPVCGCDGRTYANACFALAARVQIDHAGACGTPPPLEGGASSGGALDLLER